ncbi:hypothetical protein H5410_031682 [Solanum commersonii]|uniref:Uncharacterized protein n=1 Tax=Solanum commersonii TaxID=4109 RepID=A0A9J5YKU9_SOLCO|nr:hypothetical protein H5410_031682 [Solanum commersonii]
MLSYKIKWVFIVFKKICYEGLVGITDALGDPPFGLLHRLSVFAFSIFVFWIIGRYNTALRNRLSTLKLWARLRPFSDSPNTLGDPQAFFSSLNLLMRRSNVHSKFQVVTHHYQRISSSLYLLQMKVQAQLKQLFQLTQDKKKCLFMACNGAECKEVEGAEVPEVLEARVDKDASVSNESTSTSGKVFARAALFLSTSSHMYSASIRWILVEEEGVISISLVSSRGTPAYRHSSVISTGNDNERRTDSFWNDIIVLLMKPNQKWAAILKSLCSIGTPASIHLGVVSEIKGLNTLELWVRLRSFGDSPNALGDPQAFFSSSFQPFCSFLPSSIYALPQTPNT